MLNFGLTDMRLVAPRDAEAPRRDEAIAAAREAIATNEALYGADHPIVKRRRAELAAIEAGKPIPR